jgi:hypothetical protein
MEKPPPPPPRDPKRRRTGAAPEAEAGPAAPSKEQLFQEAKQELLRTINVLMTIHPSDPKSIEDLHPITTECESKWQGLLFQLNENRDSVLYWQSRFYLAHFYLVLSTRLGESDPRANGVLGNMLIDCAMHLYQQGLITPEALVGNPGPARLIWQEIVGTPSSHNSGIIVLTSLASEWIRETQERYGLYNSDGNRHNLPTVCARQLQKLTVLETIHPHGLHYLDSEMVRKLQGMKLALETIVRPPAPAPPAPAP